MRVLITVARGGGGCLFRWLLGRLTDPHPLTHFPYTPTETMMVAYMHTIQSVALFEVILHLSLWAVFWALSWLCWYAERAEAQIFFFSRRSSSLYTLCYLWSSPFMFPPSCLSLTPPCLRSCSQPAPFRFTASDLLWQLSSDTVHSRSAFPVATGVGLYLCERVCWESVESKRKRKKREKGNKKWDKSYLWSASVFLFPVPIIHRHPVTSPSTKPVAQLLQDVNMQDSYLPVQSDEHTVSSFSVKQRCLYPILCVCLHPRQICSLTQAQKGSLKSPQSISEGRPGFYFCRVKGKKEKKKGITFNLFNLAASICCIYVRVRMHSCMWMPMHLHISVHTRVELFLEISLRGASSLPSV